MINNSRRLCENYNDQGYFVLRHYFSEQEIEALKSVILTFHARWKKDNAAFYQEEAFNSSVITGSEYLSSDQRLTLFNFISSTKMMELITSVIPGTPVFMNTQLFFNPVNPQQKDFWHRDCQYDYDLEEQEKVTLNTRVVHLRIPLFDELGMELIPGTHKRWDNEQEFNVRQEVNGRKSHESLAGGEEIPLAAGDLFVFSADMIHRGLYGLDRLALDVLVFDADDDYVNYVDYIDDDCLPDRTLLKRIDNPLLYENALALKSKAAL